MCNLSDAIEERGEELKLIELVCRKIQKNKDIATIAEELEEERDVIQRIYDAALKSAPDYDRQKVYEFLSTRSF